MISCDDVRQRTVIDSAGLALGKVEDLILNASSWHVDTIRVRLRREVAEQVGAAKSLFRQPVVDVPTSMIQSVGDAVLLRVTAEELRTASDAYTAQAT